MQALKYTVIKTTEQYDEYCHMLEQLVTIGTINKVAQDEVELLTLLIEKWDNDNNSFDDVDPIRLLHSLMNEHNMKAKDIAALLQVNKGYVSEILNCKKGLSKEVIRKLAERFKVSQEAFNRQYLLNATNNMVDKNERMLTIQ